MKVGDLIMLSAAGRGTGLNKHVGHKELGIIKRIITPHSTNLYVVNWMKYSANFCSRYYRRELRFAK
jgi:hypothetical protein